jgi:NAD(P)-dependent dehydrogenase (short-subunit alcohol dehydrogenase family)
VTWGERQARINAISPGVISTPMGRAELEGANQGAIRALIAASNAKRPGTADDIAAGVEFLLGPSAGFISGTDLLIDGGVVAALRSGHRPVGPRSA